jgi:hypothetical protein
MSRKVPTPKKKVIKIFSVYDAHFPFDRVEERLSRTTEGQFVKAIDVASGFKGLIENGWGILVVVINERSQLLEFARVFQSFLPQIPLNFLRIIIISNNKVILTSKVLTQFSFITTLGLNSEFLRLVSLLVVEVEKLRTKLNYKNTKSVENGLFIIKAEPKQGGSVNLGPAPTSSSANVQIPQSEEPVKQRVWINAQIDSKTKSAAASSGAATGLDPKPFLKADYWNSVEQQDARDSLLNECVSSAKEVVVYDPSLRWKVRGTFQKFDEASSGLIFKAHASDLAMLERVKKSETDNLYLSSVSLDRARICITLEFVGVDADNLLFKAPEKVFEVQRRATERYKLQENEVFLFQYYEEKLSAIQTYMVEDISMGGLGIKLSSHLEPHFPVGRKIRDATLIMLNKEIKITEVDVRHITADPASPDYKTMGLQLLGMSIADLTYIELFLFSQKIAT